MSRLSLRCSVLYAVLAMVTLSCPTLVKAEGGCPQGQYPIGGQGVQGCAPIPSGGGVAAPARPSGKWIKTWGAISLSPDGASGAAAGRLSKSEAVRDAIAVCANSGGRACAASFTYKHQCAAAAVPGTGEGGTSFAGSPTIEQSKKMVLERCEAKGGLNCRVVYSECSEPVYQSY
jgi:hypothetical protein